MVIKYCESCGIEKNFKTKSSFCERKNPRTYASSLNSKYEKVFNENFKKRYEEVIKMPIGFKVTIEEAREKDSYGGEYRDAFNIATCRGLMKKYKEERKSPKSGELRYYEVWERIEGYQCLMYFKGEKVKCLCKNFEEYKVLKNE